MLSPLHRVNVILIKLPSFKTEIKIKHKARIISKYLLKSGLAFQTLKDIFSLNKLVQFRHMDRPKLKNKGSMKTV